MTAYFAFLQYFLKLLILNLTKFAFCLSGSSSLQLRGLVLEAAAGQMLLPARDVPGLGKDVQVCAEATRDDRHVSAAFKGHLNDSWPYLLPNKTMKAMKVNGLGA